MLTTTLKFIFIKSTINTNLNMFDNINKTQTTPKNKFKFINIFFILKNQKKTKLSVYVPTNKILMLVSFNKLTKTIQKKNTH